MNYLLTPAAQADIEDIWNATASRWSAQSAGRYLSVIRDACKALTDRSGFTLISDIKPGYFYCPAGDHALYFTITAKADFVVARILPRSMHGTWPSP
jgi:toxin ParE1/3/4